MHVTQELQGDASKVKVYGPAIEAPVKPHHVSYLIVDCKEAGPGLSVCLSVCRSSGIFNYCIYIMDVSFFSHYTLLLFYVLLCSYGLCYFAFIIIIVVALFALHCYLAIRLSS